MMNHGLSLSDLVDEDDIKGVLEDVAITQQGKDFVSRVLDSLVERLEEKLADNELALGTCDCMTPITSATVQRGICTNCTRPITLTIGRSIVERV